MMMELTDTERARAVLWMLETAAAHERLLTQVYQGLGGNAPGNAGPKLQQEIDRAGLVMRSLRTVAEVILAEGDILMPVIRDRALDAGVPVSVVWAAEQAKEVAKPLPPYLCVRGAR